MGGIEANTHQIEWPSLRRAAPAMTRGWARLLLAAALTALLRDSASSAPLAPLLDAPLPPVVRICVQAYTPFVVQRVRFPEQPALLTVLMQPRLHGCVRRTGTVTAWRRWLSRRASRSPTA